MACIISCGKLDTKNIIFPITAIIVLIIQNYFVYKTKIFQNLGNQHFIKVIIKSLGKCLTIIPILIFKEEINYSKEVNPIEENKENNIKEYATIFKEIAKIKNKNKYYIISLNIIINCLFDILGSYINNKYFSFWILDIIYIWIFSYFILKLILYRHHYLSIIIILILGVIINIINNGKGNNINYINIIKTISVDILFSLNIVINKYLMDNLLFIEYEICFYEGFSSLVISIIGLAVFTKYNIGDNNDYLEYYDLIDGYEIFAILFSLISQLIIYLFGLITIKYYTVFHYLIILVFNEGNFYNYSLKEWRLYVNLILYIFFIFMFLLFNENIELNCLGLEKYTKRNIIKRAYKDYLKNNNENYNDFSDSNNNIDSIIENPSKEKTNNEKIMEIGRFKFDFSDYEIIE